MITKPLSFPKNSVSTVRTSSSTRRRSCGSTRRASRRPPARSTSTSSSSPPASISASPSRPSGRRAGRARSSGICGGSTRRPTRACRTRASRTTSSSSVPPQGSCTTLQYCEYCGGLKFVSVSALSIEKQILASGNQSSRNENRKTFNIQPFMV